MDNLIRIDTTEQKIIPPVIIIGMHRSGTSLITKMLADCGMLIGYQKDHNFESTFFQKANSWILQQCGGDWDHPSSINGLLQNDEIKRAAIKHLLNAVQSPLVVSYCGIKNYLFRGFPYSMDSPWGWKDPRNTFTLPLWVELFPNAKVIHIARHGIDVAYSLQKRSQISIKNNMVNAQKKLKNFRQYFKMSRIADSPRCLDIEGGFSLWEEYMAAANNYKENIRGNYFEVKFEEFLEAPERLMLKIARFCEIDVSKEELQIVRDKINKERSMAFKRNDVLLAYSERVKERLIKWGYPP